MHKRRTSRRTLFLVLGLIAVLVIGYFLKDLHKDFKVLIERVNKVYSDLYSHINSFENISKMFQKQIDTLENRIEQLEEKKAKGKNE